jgi:hypothetical protein
MDIKSTGHYMLMCVQLCNHSHCIISTFIDTTYLVLRKSDLTSKGLNYWQNCNCYSTITHSYKVYSSVCDISAYQISHASLRGFPIYSYHGKVHLWS